jgi:hypothetical protein
MCFPVSRPLLSSGLPEASSGDFGHAATQYRAEGRRREKGVVRCKFKRMRLGTSALGTSAPIWAKLGTLWEYHEES